MNWPTALFLSVLVIMVFFPDVTIQSKSEKDEATKKKDNDA